MSVVLMSNYPLDDLHGRRVVLSRESATSSCLVRLIMAQKNQKPVFTTGRLKSVEDVDGDVDAAMIIGDAAMNQPWEKRFRYRFDLGSEWFNTTGLPFVFALWVVRESYARQYPDRVKAALELLTRSRTVGYRNIDQVVQAGAQKLNLEIPYVQEYFKRLLCDLDDAKVEGLTCFFDALHRHGIFPEKVNVRFF